MKILIVIVLSIWSICGDGGEDNVGHGDHNGCKAVAAEAAAGEDLGGDSVDFCELDDIDHGENHLDDQRRW